MTHSRHHEGPLAPAYGTEGLALVLPSVAASLGVPMPDQPVRVLPPARRAVVALIDGMGLELVRRRSGHAPFLRSQLSAVEPISSGFPSTTPTSMGTFGTGLPPGEHGMVGLRVLDPEQDATFSEISWEGGPDPRAWQSAETVFERCARAGVTPVQVAPAHFQGSGLTTAALRGARFAAAAALEDAVDRTLASVRAEPRTLVYLYWGELDKIGHVHGCGSWQWGDELERVDGALARLSASLPRDCSLTVTADHGMVDSPLAERIDLAHDAELDAGVRQVGGEGRAMMLYTRPGAADDVLATWRARLGERAWVVSREEAMSLGWFGPVSAHVVPRIGEVVAAMRGDFSMVDSRVFRPEVMRLLGLHGSLTPEEVAVPWLHRPAR